MRFFFLTLMMAACGGQPVSSTKYFLPSSLSGAGSLACGTSTPKVLVDTLLMPLRRLMPKAMFSQQQDNGQHCLYEGRIPFVLSERVLPKLVLPKRESKLHRNFVHIKNVSGVSQAVTNLSVDAGDVILALRLLHIMEKLGKLSSCRGAEFLHRKAGDLLRRGNLTEEAKSLFIHRFHDLCYGTAAAATFPIKIQSTSVIYELERELLELEPIVTKIFRDNDLAFAHVHGLLGRGIVFDIEGIKIIRQIKKVLPWVRSEDASVCQQRIRI